MLKLNMGLIYMLIKLLLLSNQGVSEMKALDIVKEQYATNFDKVCLEDTDRYYYKLEQADYYLVSEGLEDDNYYLIHLYEFVIDDIESGLGHTVTYGWYAVDRETGELQIRMSYY